MDSFRKPMRMLPIDGAPISRPVTVFTFNTFKVEQDSDDESTPDSVFESPAMTPATPTHLQCDYSSYDFEEDSNADIHDDNTEYDITDHSSNNSDSLSEDDSQLFGSESESETESDSDSDINDGTGAIHTGSLKSDHYHPEDSNDSSSAEEDDMLMLQNLSKRPAQDGPVRTAKKHKARMTEDRHILMGPAPITGNNKYNWPWID